MAFIPIKLPPGMFANGTMYQARGRWHQGNRVRWVDGALRPIGGWKNRTLVSDGANMPPIYADPTTEVARDLFFWDDAQSQIYGLIGTNQGLYYINANNEVTDITPAGFVPGGMFPVILNGYGIGIYGRSEYGTPRSDDGALAVPAARWQFDAWGGHGLAMAVQNGPIYVHVPGSGVVTAMPGAPVDNGDFIVTDQRMVMVIDPDGATGEAREVRWSDSEDYSVWTPDDTNQAGSQVLSGVGRLVSISKVLNQVLVLSTSDAQVGRYLGPPYIYGFERVGTGCGPVANGVVATTDRMAIWLGEGQFWKYDGSIQPVECDVMDFLRRDINEDWFSTMYAHALTAFSEVWWHYKSNTGTSTDVDSYVAYNYLTGAWTVGRLDRTTGVDKTPTRDPVMIDKDGFVFNHEQKAVEVENAFAITGPLELGQGDKFMAVRRIIPDTEVFGDVTMTLLGKQMPTMAEGSFGPYPYLNPTPVMVTARQIRLRVDGQAARWEVGDFRFDIAEAGTAGR